MKLFSANLQNLRQVYTVSLRKALDMERQIIKALGTMIEKSDDEQLRNAFQTHLEETRGHASKVEQLLHSMGEDDSMSCKAISGLVSEAEDMIKDAGDPAVLDVSLIAAGQQVEHHEIAVYGTLKTWATYLNLNNQAEVLDSILAQEKQTNELLTNIADRVNATAEEHEYAGSTTR